MKIRGVNFFLPVIFAGFLFGCTGHKPASTDPLLAIQQNYAVASNIEYKSIDSASLKLDVYAPVLLLGDDPWVQYPDTVRPAVIFFHGGGWVSGDRTSRIPLILPYLEKYWCLVNVDYRIADGTHACIEDCATDCKDAINWVIKNAASFKIDTSRLYLAGESAGGHLALLTGLKFTYPCRIAGIINWYGISDMEDLYSTWNNPPFFDRMTMSSGEATHEMLKRNSPVNCINHTDVPVISIHGDNDAVVPIAQSQKLHKMLDNKGIRNKLVVIKGKKHGNFSAEDLSMAYEEIWKWAARPPL
jgi:acetyl esterase/lipase